MPRYGSVHRIVDFVSRTIPNRGSGAFRKLFAHRAIEFMKCLDAVQAKNPSVTLTAHTGDAIWLSFKGRRVFACLPRMNHISVLILKNGPPESKRLIALIRSAHRKYRLFRKKSTPSYVYFLWHAGRDDFPVLEKFVKGLPTLTDQYDTKRYVHPRNFPGEVRQLALEIFQRGGSYCPGFGNKHRHRVDLNRDRVEFDHILPYARGGSSSDLNVQVLCQDCNRAKHATSL
jgi:5-methylcytosine-specific restriction endonuclease McrA